VSSAANVNLETFLSNHPKLEQLDILVNDGGTDMQNNMDLWGVIKRHCSAAGISLKKLHIELSDYFLSCSGARVDWSFLEGMKSLEDFRLESTLKPLEYGLRFLECLSRNQKLERLSVNGMHVRGSFWRYYSEGQGRTDVTEEVQLATKLDLLGRFRNLKRLSFRRSWNAIDDEVLQFILIEMTSLEELEMRFD